MDFFNHNILARNPRRYDVYEPTKFQRETCRVLLESDRQQILYSVHIYLMELAFERQMKT